MMDKAAWIIASMGAGVAIGWLAILLGGHSLEALVLCAAVAHVIGFAEVHYSD